MFDVYFVAKKEADIPAIKRQLLEKEFYGDTVHVVNSCLLDESDRVIIFRDIEPNKENSIYLDHAGNVSRHGFAEDIVPEELDDGTKEYSERQLTKEKKEPKVKECPQCYQQMVGVRCNKCGYEIPVKEQIETDQQELEQLHSVNAKAWQKKTSSKEKAEFYGMLKHYVISRGNDIGRAAHMYRERSGVWPNAYKNTPAIPPNQGFKNYIKHLAIKRRYSK